MNNVFDLKRFGKYFLYDLHNAWGRFGLSMIICGTSLVIAFVLSIFLHVFFNNDLADTVSVMKGLALVVSLAVVMMAMPVKLYGCLTDRRAGSTWLLVPASTFEKFLSMVALVCLVAPLCLFVLMLASDSLLGLLFPAIYGSPFISGELEELGDWMNKISGIGLHINLAGAAYLGWCENILFFTVGAACFKKSKTAKTILAYFIIISVISSLAMWSVGSLDSWAFFKSVDDVDMKGAVGSLNIIVNVVYIIVFTLLLGGLYLRLRTLKH